MDCQSDSNSGDEVIPQRRSTVKKVFLSDDEDDLNPLPIHTEDISLKLTDDEENSNENTGVAMKDSVRANSDSESVHSDLPSVKNVTLPSQEESVLKESSILNKPPSSPDFSQKNMNSKHSTLLDSDSDDEKQKQQSPNSTGRKKSLWDSDSDEDTGKKDSPKSSNKKHRSIWDSDSEENVDDPPAVSKKAVASTKTSAKSLYDSDSDETEQPNENHADEPNGHWKGKPSKSSGSKKVRASSKDAMLAIRSESQRMTREAALALPYHKPKQHSLSDFLNRPRFVPISMKLSAEEVIEYQNSLKESEKKLKEFYKSDSEHSDSGDENCEDVTTNKKPPTDVAAGTEPETIKEVKVPAEGDAVIHDEPNTEAGEEPRADSGRASADVDQSHGEPSMDGEDIVAKASSNKCERQVADECAEPLKDKSEDGANGASSSKPEVTVANSDLGECSEDAGEIVARPDSLCKPEAQAADGLMGQLHLSKPSNQVEKEIASPDSREPERNNEGGAQSEATRDMPENKAGCVADGKMDIAPLSDSEDELQEKDVVKIEEAKPIQLKGNPEDMIDLDDFSEHSKTDLQGFKQRFLRHSITSKPKASPTSLAVKVVDKTSDGSVLGISEEVVSWTAEDKLVNNTPPGLKMKMLKLELQRQIIEMREKEFLHKHDQDKPKGNKPDYEDGNDLTESDEKDIEEEDDNEADADDEDNDSDDAADEDDEEDLEFNLDESESQRARKKRQRNSFVDEEADVDDDSDEGGDGDDDEDQDGGEDSSHFGMDEDTKKEKSGGGSQLLRKLPRANTNVDLFASQEASDDEDIPGYQPGGGLQNRNDDLQPNSPSQSTQGFSLPSTNWSAKPTGITQCTPFSTFPFDSEETDGNSSNLVGLSFRGYSDDGKDTIRHLAESPDAPETEADLMALCSGKFTSQLPPMDSQVVGAPASMAISQDSQDELKLSEDPPMNTDMLKTKPRGYTRMILESSDDEDEESNEEENAKQKTRRLSFSDEEDSNSANSLDGSEEGDEHTEPVEVMYDSDENEIPVKGAAFLENEAELSEDEYVGSGDEDDDLLADKMEEELGDQDDIDQDQVREELGRIHMRKLLDEDRRDVRLMQEMLLEDGELHIDGKGRERQFRWKNIDLSSLTTTVKADSDEEVEEDEEDAEWRKVRYAREVFLMEGHKKDKTDADIEEDDGEDSELMRLGRIVLAKKTNTRVESKEVIPPKPPAAVVPESPVKSLYQTTRNSRGSFLKRASDALTRLAEMATGKDGVLEKKPKNSRNFVFSVESPPKENVNGADVQNEQKINAKRKAKRSLASQPEKKPRSQSSTSSSLFDLL